MVRKNIRNIILLLVVFLFCLFCTSKLLLLAIVDENNHDDFYAMEKDSIDVLFVGSSHSYCGFIPERLSEKYKISSYNLASSNQSMLANYLWAKEAYEYQKYKVLVVEAMSIPMSHGEVENDIRSLHSMGNSIHYYELVKTYKRQSLNIIFPIFLFHQSWDKINVDKMCYEYPKSAEILRGYVPLYSRAGEENVVDIIDETDESIGYLKYDYLDKLREFCQKNEIQLILVKTPMANTRVNQWDAGLHNNVAIYASQHDIPFIDFNLEAYADACDLHPAKDIAADGRHCNYWGACKVTDYMGNYLKSLF